MAVFQARARTVDMLGHQQVTNIATAISELFKNAHDAYATNVDIDYLRAEDLLVIRDNGIGMSPEDFENRWLTLAADSAATRKDAPKPPKGMPKRPIQGEKGIGRLAIATIGPQALVLTRPGGQDAVLTMALINWRLFEISGLNLADIEIPIAHFSRASTPTETDLAQVVAAMRDSLSALKLPRALATPITADLNRLALDPAGLLQQLDGARTAASDHGTVFIITPTREELLDDLKQIQAETDPPPGLLKTLIGFSNTMTPDAGEPRIQPAFRDHRSLDDVEDVIATREFFTASEFKKADHSFTGEFDEFGSFAGTVDVYGSGPNSYPWTWSGAKGGELGCGPFKLSLAYVQGERTDSRLERKAYDALDAKLERIGGIYVYRDGIRVLPYGDPEFDFLQFEERRSLRASRYFFSYRRMFGAIELDGQRNASLREKAGREGFRNDRAYRDFTGLLKDFFVAVAADFFVEGGSRAGEFELGRQRTRDRHARLAAREKEAKKRRAAFQKALAAALTRIDDGQPLREAATLLDNLREDLVAGLGPKGARGERLGAIEASAFDNLDALRGHYRVRPPAGFGLSRALRGDWEALLAAQASLENEIWAPTAAEISRLVGQARREGGAAPGWEDRLIEVIDGLVSRRGAQADAAAQAARRSLSAFDSEAEGAIELLTKDISSAAAEASASARNGTGPPRTEKQLVSKREAIEAQLASATAEKIEELELLGELLAQGLASLGIKQGDGGSLVGLIEEEVLDLRDRAEQDLELAQVGMATQVISHELNATVLAVRSGLRRLSVWAEENDDLRPLYDDLRGSFDHLDGYLSLFTPLQRRLRRRREQLSGKRIESFLRELFGRRLEKDEVELEVTEGFRRWQASGYRSTVYPVLVNLVDNSVYWVIESRRRPRWIKLDATERDLIISDSGPGVPDRDRDQIWEFGFTRKPRGRGAGLHIAREVLQGEGWAIELGRPRKGVGATFRIAPEK
jgi:signal transduction histidine kinase